MERHEYIFLPINIIPDEIIEKHFLRDMSKYGYVYAQIRKGIYGIPQVGIIVNYFLAKNLAPRGYYQCHNTTVMWKHKWNPVTFSLLVDGFGVKYVRKNIHITPLIVSENIIQTRSTGMKAFTGTMRRDKVRKISGDRTGY